MRVPGFALVIVGVALLLAIIIALAFGGFGQKQADTNQQMQLQAIDSIANSDASVSFLTDGVINSSDEHRQINITVSRSAARLTIYKGYQNVVLAAQSFANNQAAYQQFLAAIKTAGFFSERSSAVTSPDGQCPLGWRYIYSSNGVAGTPNNLWLTTCGTKTGTFGGNVNTINQLFQNQIPNYSNLVSNVSLN